MIPLGLSLAISALENPSESYFAGNAEAVEGFLATYRIIPKSPHRIVYNGCVGNA